MKKLEAAYWVKDKLNHQITMEKAVELLDGLVDEVGMSPPANLKNYSNYPNVILEWEPEE